MTPTVDHEAILSLLMADPRFRAAVSDAAKSAQDQSPAGKVRESVHAAVKQSPFALARQHADAIAEVAHRHAARTLAAQSAPDDVRDRSPGMAGGNDTGLRAGADAPARAHDREAQPASKRRATAGTVTATAASRPIRAPASVLKNARRAPDGNHYVPDPKRPGKYLMVVVNHSQGASAALPTDASPAPRPGQGNMRSLLLIRHGSTDLNSNDTSVDRIRAHKDVPLNAEGKAEAARTGETIAKNPPDMLVASDLCRAKLTAQIISQRTGIPVSWVSDHFRPWDAGKLTGQKSSKAVPIMAQYAEHRPDEPLPGGESFNVFKHRFFTGLAETLRRHPGGTVGVVSHHRNERLLHAWRAAGFPPNGDIDIKTFNQKGETTGAAQPFQIPADRVAVIAQRTAPNAAMDTQASRAGGSGRGDIGASAAAKTQDRPGNV